MLVVRNEHRAALPKKGGEGELPNLTKESVIEKYTTMALLCSHCSLSPPCYASSLITSHHIKAVRQMIRYLDALN